MKQRDSSTPPELIFFGKRLRAAKRIPVIMILALVVYLLAEIVMYCGLRPAMLLLFFTFAGIFLTLFCFLPWILGIAVSVTAAAVLADAGERALRKEPARVAAFKRLTLISFICDGAALVILTALIVHIQRKGFDVFSYRLYM